MSRPDRLRVPFLVPLGLLVLGACKAQEANIVDRRPSRSFEFTYQAGVEDVPTGAGRTRLWLPLPPDTLDQRIDDLAVRASNGARWVDVDGDRGSDGDGADRIAWTVSPVEDGPARSLCVETPGTAIQVELLFDVTRYETRGGGAATPAELREALAPDSMVPLDGKVATEAAALRTSADPRTAARELYDHVLERMRYDKPQGGDWGRGDAEWACDSGYGNCTDFHSYFMGLARAKGIPARFEMGFPVPDGDEPVATIGGYHCWAWFWIDGEGWVPVDISEADKHPELADYYFGTLDPDRVTMSEGRDLVLTPPTAAPLNFLVYPYAEVDGRPAGRITKAFSRRID